jgi:hypothetical protein
MFGDIHRSQTPQATAAMRTTPAKARQIEDNQKKRLDVEKIGIGVNAAGRLFQTLTCAMCKQAGNYASQKNVQMKRLPTKGHSLTTTKLNP